MKKILVMSIMLLCMIFSVSAVDNIEISESTLLITGYRGSTTTGSFVINNTGANATDVSFSGYTLSDGSTTITLTAINDIINMAPASSQTVNFDVDISTSKNLGNYTGTLTATGDSSSDTMDINLLVEKAPNKLVIEEVDVYIDGTKEEDNIADGATIDAPAKPESNVSFWIQIKNEFDSDVLIDDIEIKITIEGIDDGDDIEEEVTGIELEDGDSEYFMIRFTIPFDAEEEDYDVVIEVDGEDEASDSHSDQMDFVLEVDREPHDIDIKEAKLTPKQVKCGEKSDLYVLLKNIGSNDEDFVVFTVKNDDLNINYREEFSLENDLSSDDSKFEKTFVLNIPDDATVGLHTIHLKTYYNLDNLVSFDVLKLEVTGCASYVAPIVPAPTPDPTPTPDDDSDDGSGSDDTDDSTGVDNGDDTLTNGQGELPVLPGDVPIINNLDDENDGFSTLFFVFLVILNIGVIVVIIYLIVGNMAHK